MTSARTRISQSAHVALVLSALLLAAVPVHAGGLDSDGDGLDDATELALGTDPLSVDSDCDGLDDAREVVSPGAPADADNDGMIDALESAVRDTDLDGPVDEADAQSAGQARIGCARFHPLAVALDGSEPARVEVRVMGTAVSAVSLSNLFSVVGISVQGAPFPQLGGSIVLYDDGSHGDRIASDGIWSRGDIRSQATPVPPLRLAAFDQLTVTDNLGTRAINLYQTAAGAGSGAARLGQLDPSLRRAAQPLAGEFMTTRHVAFVVDAMAEVEVRRYLMLRPPVADVRLLTQQFYALFPDVYDFLLVEPASPSIRGLAGAHTPVSNAVDGIGRPLLDNTADWGSGGRLQSAVFYNFTDSGPFVHEIVHRWGNYLDPALGIGQCQGGHWGVAGVGYGAIGGFEPDTLQDNGNGTYSAPLSDFSLAGPSVDITPMNALELYVAGFTTAAETPDFVVPVNVDCGSLTFNGSDGTFSFAADGLVTRTVADIVAVEGARSPAAGIAQTRFQAAWLVYIDHLPNPTEAGWFENQSRYLGLREGELSYRLSFEQAAAGLATLETGLLAVFGDGFE